MYWKLGHESTVLCVTVVRVCDAFFLHYPCHKQPLVMLMILLVSLWSHRHSKFQSHWWYFLLSFQVSNDTWQNLIPLVQRVSSGISLVESWKFDSCLTFTTHVLHMKYCINGLAQDCSNSSALALELLQSCTKPSVWYDTVLIRYDCNISKDHFVNAPSQWEVTLHCNVVSLWLGAFTKWSLYLCDVNPSVGGTRIL